MSLVKMRNRVSYLVYMYTFNRRRENFDKKYYNCVFFNLMAWKASWAHRTDENEKKKIMMK